MNVHFAFILGLVAAFTNFVPYIGQLIGGALPTVIVLGQNGSIGDALIVAAMYLAVLGVEEYVITPLVMGRSLDLNGTTVLIACLFWGYLWGLVGLILAMPITVSLKVVFQAVPELNRWAELMSLDWQSPDAPEAAPVPQPGRRSEAPVHRAEGSPGCCPRRPTRRLGPGPGRRPGARAGGECGRDTRVSRGIRASPRRADDPIPTTDFEKGERRWK